MTRTLAALLVVAATTCVADPLLKNAGTRLGPVITFDCSADAGINCTRTAATGTANLRCSTATATEPGCVSTGIQVFGGIKNFKSLTDGGTTLYVGSDGIYTKTLWDWGAPGDPSALDIVGQGLDPISAVRISSWENLSDLTSRIASFGVNSSGGFTERAAINPLGTITSSSFLTGTLGLGTGATGTGTAFASFPAATANNIGRMLYDTTNKALRISDGTTWHIVRSNAAPTISSGFGTAPSITGTASSFKVTVGTPNASTTGLVLLNATAPSRFVCQCTNVTNPNQLLCTPCSVQSDRVDLCSWNWAGVATAFVAGNELLVTCTAY